MQYTRLPGIDKDWSRITLGCWQMAPSEGWGDVCSPRDADAVVKTALEGGITAFDTAEGYGEGESEKRLGQALGSRKDDVIIISKIWPDAELKPSAYQNHLEDTLRALGRDYVDVYLIHWPGDFFSTEEKSKRLAEIMFHLKKSGKAAQVGLSNFHLENLKLLGDDLSVFSVNQVPYSLLKRRYEGATREYCQKAGIPYMAFSPLAVGLLAGPPGPEALNYPARRHNALFQEPMFTEALKVLEEVQQVARDIDRKPVEVALAWVLAQDNILSAVVGSRKTKQVREFAGAGDLTLTESQRQRLTQASDAFHKNCALVV